MKKILLSLLAIATMASCSKEEGSGLKGENVDVNFNGSIEMTTKAATAFTKAYNGVVGVISSDAWVTDYDKVGLTIAADGKLTPASDIYIPSATYTFTSVATDHTALPVRTTDAYPLVFGKVSDNATTGGDIVFATASKAVSKADKAVALKYDHVYGQVTFAIAGTSGQFTDAELNGATIKVTGFIKGGTLDAKTGTITNVAADTYTGELDTRDVAYYALPQEMDDTDFLTVEVTINSEKYTGTIKDVNGKIEPNKHKTITITVGKSGLTFTGTLEEWAATTGSGSAS